MNFFCIDPGNVSSGVVEMTNEAIRCAYIAPNRDLLRIIREKKAYDDENGEEFMVISEDLQPYSLRMNQQTLDTIKFVGVLQHVFAEEGIQNRWYMRWQVKKLIYDDFGIAKNRVIEKIARENKRTKAGELVKPSFVYVDDRIIHAAMKEQYRIPTPKPGKKSLYGLTKHCWQALALGWLYTQPAKPCENQTLDTI